MFLVINNMVERISNYLVDQVICKGENVSEDEREIISFGVTRIVEDVPKYIIMIMIAIITNTLVEFGIVCLVTIVYKTFIGGAHARTNMSCLVSSNIIFFTPIILSKYIEWNKAVINSIYGIVFLISIFVIKYIAPADTEEVPILNKKRRKSMKMQGGISLISIYIIALVFIKDINIKEVIVFTIAMIDIYATKPMYRIYKCKYSYESEEFKEYFEKSKEN